MRHVLRDEMLVSFKRRLVTEEKSSATIEKYMRDVRCFLYYIRQPGLQEAVTKERAIAWKEALKEKYAPTSVNSMLASVNHFFKVQGWEDCRMKSLKLQHNMFRFREQELTREEYRRLITAAEAKGNKRLSCLMQTLGSTGIRVSEIPFITAEAVERGRAHVSMKGKERIVLLPGNLCRLLTAYMEERGICSGSIFVTRNGNNMDRSNIFHEMKSLCGPANVAPAKVFPHNFRHLFACTYYRKEKDIVHLADLLGHSNINTTRIYTMVSAEEQERQLLDMELVFRNTDLRTADSAGEDFQKNHGNTSGKISKKNGNRKKENRKKNRKRAKRHLRSEHKDKNSVRQSQCLGNGCKQTADPFFSA